MNLCNKFFKISQDSIDEIFKIDSNLNIFANFLNSENEIKKDSSINNFNFGNQKNNLSKSAFTKMKTKDTLRSSNSNTEINNNLTIYSASAINSCMKIDSAKTNLNSNNSSNNNAHNFISNNKKNLTPHNDQSTASAKANQNQLLNMCLTKSNANTYGNNICNTSISCNNTSKNNAYNEESHNKILSDKFKIKNIFSSCNNSNNDKILNEKDNYNKNDENKDFPFMDISKNLTIKIKDDQYFLNKKLSKEYENLKTNMKMRKDQENSIPDSSMTNVSNVICI